MSLPFHEQLLQLIHGVAQLVRKRGDFVEGQVELPQRGAGDGGVKGQQGTHAVTGDIEHAERGQGKQLHRQRLQLVALQVQSSQTVQTLPTNTHKASAFISFLIFVSSVIQHRSDLLPGRALKETPADCCGSGRAGGGGSAAAARSRRPSDRTQSPARSPTDPAGGSSPALWAEQRSSHQSPELTKTDQRRQIIRHSLL